MERTTQSAHVVRFANFEIDLEAGELRKAGVKLKFSGQPFQVLAMLLERPGAVVTREELQKRLWPDTFVDIEHNLNSAINRIREALGDSSENPCFVETLPRRGYRFIAPVEGFAKDEAAALMAGLAPGAILQGSATSRKFSVVGRRSVWVPVLSTLVLVVAGTLWMAGSNSGRRLWARLTHSATPHISSIAVLPLANLSGDPEQEYFADGTTDELITQLSKATALKVISRTSVMRYKGTKKSVREIAQELGVDAVVEGTIVRSGNRVRISAQLIDAVNDAHLWSEDYERDLADILALQAEVALAITKRISVTITSEQQRQLASAPPVNPEAYEFYLKGRHFLWHREVSTAVENFLRAIDKDPQYAKAYAGLAESYVIFEGGGGGIIPEEAIGKAKVAASRALQLDSKLAGPHVTLAWAKLTYDRDWAGAEEEFKLAKELDPNYETAPFWYGCELTWKGDFEHGLAEMHRAKELAPTSPLIVAFFGMALYQARQKQQAVKMLEEAIRLEPTLPYAHNWLGLTYLTMGMQENAIAELEKAAEVSRARHIRTLANISRLGYGYAITGRVKQARAILDELSRVAKTRYVSPVQFANIYIGLGDKERALFWLERAYRDRSMEIMLIKVDPRFDSLHSDPRFQDLLRRLNFPN